MEATRGRAGHRCTGDRSGTRGSRLATRSLARPGDLRDVSRRDPLPLAGSRPRNPGRTREPSALVGLGTLLSAPASSGRDRVGRRRGSRVAIGARRGLFLVAALPGTFGHRFLRARPTDGATTRMSRELRSGRLATPARSRGTFSRRADPAPLVSRAPRGGMFPGFRRERRSRSREPGSR